MKVKLTPEQLLKDIENVEGPCLKMCAYCPEQAYLGEIKDVVETLMAENKELKEMISRMRKEISECRNF